MAYLIYLSDSKKLIGLIYRDKEHYWHNLKNESVLYEHQKQAIAGVFRCRDDDDYKTILKEYDSILKE
jgi:hypothetical protein